MSIFLIGLMLLLEAVVRAAVMDDVLALEMEIGGV